jgi:hypothetical protein
MRTPDGDVLEVSYAEDDNVKMQGKVPIPSTIDYQVDYMAIQYMELQMKLIVNRLKAAIFGTGNIRKWYEIYLSCFVLLCSLESVHARQVEILHRFRNEVSENNNLLLITLFRFLTESFPCSESYQNKDQPCGLYFHP